MSVVANNRFLQRTNPVMRAAITDGGSVLGNEYIQRSARQMVDKGLYGNLVDWIDRDLVKTRTSGTDLFIPKAYDISPNENDPAQTDTTTQPLLEAKGMRFDGNGYLGFGNYVFPTGAVTWMGWLKSGRIIIETSDIMGNGFATTNIAIRILTSATVDVDYILRHTWGVSGQGFDFPMNSKGVLLDPAYYHICFAWDGTDNTDGIKGYVNGVLQNTGTMPEPNDQTHSNAYVGDKCRLGERVGGSGRQYIGEMADVRVINELLSATDIKDIHDLTNSIRGYYTP